MMKLIKHVDSSLAMMYAKDCFDSLMHRRIVSRQFENKEKISKPEMDFSHFKYCFAGCKRISELSEDHPARTYVSNRKIPNEFWNVIYYTDSFDVIAKRFDPKYENRIKKESRILFPIVTRNRRLHGVVGRCLPLDKNAKRYVTIRSSGFDGKLWYGLWRISKESKKVTVVEGPIDSLFLNDSVAVLGLATADMQIPIELAEKDLVFVLDNEPRNKEVVSKMRELIRNGMKVCVWPKNTEGKDINEMILRGLMSSEIQSIIDANTKRGLEALLAINEWSKTDDCTRI
jgi:hypothetical protein